jgi:hypothetical protein
MFTQPCNVLIFHKIYFTIYSIIYCLEFFFPKWHLPTKWAKTHKSCNRGCGGKNDKEKWHPLKQFSCRHKSEWTERKAQEEPTIPLDIGLWPPPINYSRARQFRQLGFSFLLLCQSQRQLCPSLTAAGCGINLLSMQKRHFAGNANFVRRIRGSRISFSAATENHCMWNCAKHIFAKNK